MRPRGQRAGSRFRVGGNLECACDFVEGMSVERFLPTPEEEDEVIKRYLAREQAKSN